VRRCLLIDQGAGLRIIGSCYSPDTARLREFAARNLIPHRWFDLERDAEAERLLRYFGLTAQDTPVAIWGGDVLRNPSNSRLARLIGLPVPDPRCDQCDLLVVGAGPAGLAAAVYGAADGLQTSAMERIAAGGQTGASSRIENYLGFPAGISGAELAERAIVQASKFGAHIGVSAEAVRLGSDGGQLRVEFDNGGAVTARAVVIATGAKYRKLDVLGCHRRPGAIACAGVSNCRATAARPAILIQSCRSIASAGVSHVPPAHPPSLAMNVRRYLTPGRRFKARRPVVITRAYRPALIQGGTPTGSRRSVAMVCASVYFMMPCSP
jgi:hypothetical protein